LCLVRCETRITCFCKSRSSPFLEPISTKRRG